MMSTQDQTAADRDAIRQLMIRYNMAGDRGKVAELAQVFAEDGVIRFNDEATQGRQAIARRLGGGVASPGLVVTRHHLTTSLIEVDGDAATGRTYFQVLTNIGPDHHGVYVDRFARIDDTWLIVYREVRIDWQVENSVFPPLHVRGIALAGRSATDDAPATGA
jgi:hypothetical protein